MKTKRKTVGLALGGGAIRGIAHVAVIETFVNAGIPIDYIAGTSAGAWVGACYAVYPDITKVRELTVGKRNEKLMATFRVNRFRLAKKGDAMSTILTEAFADKTFSDVKIPLAITAVDIEQGTLSVLSTGKLASAVRASMSVPGLFPPVERKGEFLIDGGVLNPVPADVAREMGADVIIAVNLDKHLHKPMQATKKMLHSPIRIGIRTTEIMRREITQAHVKHADVILAPDIPYVGIDAWKQFFVNKNEQEYFAIGRRAAEAALPDIKKIIS